MPPVTADLIEGRAGDDPVLDLALATALLAQVASGRRGPVIRVYRPLPTVAFGRRDSFLEGFARAAAAARRADFTPAIRSAGGRAAAYHEECLVIDEIVPARDAMAEVDARFAAEAESQAQALRDLGIDARVGEVPGEYCRGRFSVNARGQAKLIGAAQRIISGAWLFSTVVVVGGGPCVRAVLEQVYAALGLDWDPASVGSVADELAAATVEQLQAALLAPVAARYRLTPSAVSEDEWAAARDLSARHRAVPGARSGG
ncbi:MAG: lipoyl protein ligase domain-containing protein [Solirubrobacteraceae bacterium]